jgi:hypothetical protein
LSHWSIFTGFAKGLGRRIPNDNPPGTYDTFAAGNGRVEIVPRQQSLDESWVTDAVSGDIVAMNGAVTQVFVLVCRISLLVITHHPSIACQWVQQT